MQCDWLITWVTSSILCTGCRSISVYNTNCVSLCMVLVTGMHQTTSPIWLHWHQLRWAGHVFALPTASPLTSLERRWAIVHSRSLVRAHGTHFLLTFIVHPAWTLLRSISNNICFLLLMIYNNFFYLILVTVYCCVFYVLLLLVHCWPRLSVSTFCIDWLIDWLTDTCIT